MLVLVPCLCVPLLTRAAAVYEVPPLVVKDRAALLALKASITNPPSGMAGWLNSNLPCLPTWEYIEVRWLGTAGLPVCVPVRQSAWELSSACTMLHRGQHLSSCQLPGGRRQARLHCAPNSGDCPAASLPCSVQCDLASGRVSRLRLANMGLHSSQLPDELGDLTALISLDLSGGHTGQVVCWAGRGAVSCEVDPGHFYLLPAAQRCRVGIPSDSCAEPHVALRAGNRIAGTLPTAWGSNPAFRNLTDLNLAGGHAGIGCAAWPAH